MVDLSSVVMDDDELTAFLAGGGTGVLSFSTAADESPYSLPVSYGYSEPDGPFFFRLAFPTDGGKAEFVDGPVTFVTHRETDGGWQTAVATGTPEEGAEAEYDTDALQEMWSVEIPLVEIFERPTTEVTFRYFRLDPEQISGRKETTARP
jgi:nitroimidazol reductase NimA-like FMN-containing flavoprotein (pyridoxamine 5'-phosphate oxidase superfamily)